MTEHSIVALSFTDRPNWIACKCGQFVDELPGAMPIDQSWAVHRGDEWVARADRYVARASDAEVSDFLNKISNPWYSPPGLKPKPVSYSPLGRETAEDRAKAALLAIYEMGLECTCEPGKPISRDCPNFQEGDDE